MKWSVIIPMGRPETALPTFQSLADQTVKPAEWEILVVGVKAAEIPGRFPQLPIRPVVLEKNLIPPHTRVTGVEQARGDWYLFVDDDIELATDFLARLIPLAEQDATVGAIGVRLPGRQGAYFERLTDITNFWSQQNLEPGAREWLYSATLAIPAKAYHQAGGFNPTLPNGEDVDLTQRIVRQGFHLRYEPSLVAYHNHRRTTLFSMWRYFWYSGNTAQCWHIHCEYPRVFSLKTAVLCAALNLQANWRLNRGRLNGLLPNSPLILLNYLIFQLSVETHYQQYLWKNNRYRELPPLTRSDRVYVGGARDWQEGRRLRGAGGLLLAGLLDVLTPKRR